MMKFLRNVRRRGDRTDYWLAGQFAGRVNSFADPAMATWSEILGREQAKLWMTARAVERR